MEILIYENFYKIVLKNRGVMGLHTFDNLTDLKRSTRTYPLISMEPNNPIRTCLFDYKISKILTFTQIVQVM